MCLCSGCSAVFVKRMCPGFFPMSFRLVSGLYPSAPSVISYRRVVFSVVSMALIHFASFGVLLQGRHNASHDEDGSEEGEDDGDVEESYDNIEGTTFKPLCLEFLWDAECGGRLFLNVHELCRNCMF
jgi:hypothetical protein